MSNISLILRDLKPSRVRKTLTPEQWSEVMEAFERGVTVKAIFAALSGKVDPFFKDELHFRNALSTRRRKVTKK